MALIDTTRSTSRRPVPPRASTTPTISREIPQKRMRLPLEVSPIFREWLKASYPDRYEHVMSVMRSMRGGKDYDSEWGVRQRGKGPYAWMIGRRFEMAAKRLGLNTERRLLRNDLFTAPVPVGGQMKLF